MGGCLDVRAGSCVIGITINQLGPQNKTKKDMDELKEGKRQEATAGLT